MLVVTDESKLLISTKPQKFNYDVIYVARDNNI